MAVEKCAYLVIPDMLLDAAELVDLRSSASSTSGVLQRSEITSYAHFLTTTNTRIPAV